MTGLPPGLPADRTAVGLFTNFSRLTDKALREYDAARAELLQYVAPHEGLVIGPYLRAIDHMENCVSATHRAVLNATALRDQGVGCRAPQLTERQKERLTNVRHAIEHSDEKLLGLQKYKKSPPFDKADPYSLRLANTCLVIGQNQLTYRDLVSAMTKCHKTIEVIRGVPTGDPGPRFPNAKLRTELGPPPPPPPGTVHMLPTDYTRELSRLIITHS